MSCPRPRDRLPAWAAVGVRVYHSQAVKASRRRLFAQGRGFLVTSSDNGDDRTRPQRGVTSTGAIGAEPMVAPRRVEGAMVMLTSEPPRVVDEIWTVAVRFPRV